MITARLMGGLGNNLFQIANLMARSKESGYVAKVLPHVERYHYGKLNGSVVLEVEDIFEDTSYMTNDLSKERFVYYGHPDMGGYFGYTKPPVFDGILYDGYFQSHRYFESIDHRSLFAIKGSLQQRVRSEHRLQRNSVAVHCRFAGDRLKPETLPYHGVVSMGFYKQALERIQDILEETLSVYVVTDDPDAGKVERMFADICPTAEISVVNGDMQSSFALMAMCSHSVLGNSTYSWWAAMINPNNPIVVAPNTEWFGPLNSHIHKGDLFPSDWILI
jgi:hypothetical protein